MAYEEQNDQQDVNAHQQRINAARDEYKQLDLNALCAELVRVRDQKDELEQQLKDLNARFDVLRFEIIPTMMDDLGIGSPYNVKGLGRLTLTADIRVNVKDKPTLFQWLRKNKLGDLIKEDVNAATLKASFKRRVVEGLAIPDSVTVTPLTRAAITKLK